LSSNGKVLAAGGAGGTIMLWSVAQRSVLHALAYRTNYPLPIALSPDGTLLAAGGCAQVKNGSCTQGQVLLWNVMSGNRNGLLPGHQSTVWDVAFSPGGEILASSSYDGIELWNVTARQSSGWLTISANDPNNSYAGYYSTILFSSNGKMAASYSSPGTLFSFVLWDMTRREPFAHAFNEQDSFQGSVAFSPNNQQLVSVADHGGVDSIIAWDIAIQSWQNHACTIANRNLTRGEWKQFIRYGTAWSKVCPDFAL